MEGLSDLRAVGQFDDVIVPKNIWGRFLHHAEDFDGQGSNLDVRVLITSKLDKVTESSALAVTKIFVSQAFGRTLRAAWRAIFLRKVACSTSENLAANPSTNFR